MAIQQNLRALLELIDDIQNAQQDFKGEIDSEQLGTLFRQANNPQSGIFGDSIEQLLRRSLTEKFKAALVEIEGREKQENTDLIEVLVENVKVHREESITGILDKLPIVNVAGEGLRLISAILTSIFRSNRRKMEKMTLELHKASNAVMEELAGHFRFLENLSKIDVDYEGSLKSMEVQAASLESSLFNISEALISLFRKVVPNFTIGDDVVALSARVNHVLNFADNEIMNNQQRLDLLERDFSNFLFFVSTNAIGLRSHLVNSWSDYNKVKKAYYETFIDEVDKFQSADPQRKTSFLTQVRTQSQTVSGNLDRKIENITQDLNRKVSRIAF